MPDEPSQETRTIQTAVFEIRLRGHLDEQWAEWFGGLSIILEEGGDTLLIGPVADQAALYGLLRKVRDLGLQLLSVNSTEAGKQDHPTGKP